MKNVLRVLSVSAAVIALSSAPALADDHGDKMHHKGDRGAKMFEKHDTDGDGVVTKEEALSHAEARFDKMDADGDGKLTKDEAKAAKEKMREKWKEMKDKKDAMDSGDGAEAE